MIRDPRYDILFDPVAIGPVTAPNRFYQVPHASGMTNALPRTRASFRETKAEGGWGVVCTGACSIHPSSDDSPLPFATLWDKDDIRSHALMTDAVHRHGSLAGVELFHGGAVVMNRTTRMPPLSPSGTPWMANHIGFMSNQRPRTMDKSDIRDLLRWQAEGARKARSAGFDIVYVYAGMGYLPYEFLLSDYNQRSDEFGGSVENRVRLIRQMIEVTKEAVGQQCGVALRISLEEMRKRPSEAAESEAHEVIARLAEDPDLFDVKMDSSPTDCSASRFSGEGSHEPVIDFVKKLTKKPVVGVGRFTSPDTMVSQVRRGVLDLIGGARPSIADPFLPNKIKEGRQDEIRECIGCNICISSWHDGVPVRCTQNATAGEEWRRGWHPEKFEPVSRAERVLVVGGGPSGLEAARVLAMRGADVTVADAGKDFGGRLKFETRLPGLSAWGRVLDYRLSALRTAPNVGLFLDSPLGVEDILEFGCERVVLATGARWTRELYGLSEIPTATPFDVPNVYTPDDLAAGIVPEGPVAVFDYDNYYMGGLVAESLAARGLTVTYVTSAGNASTWTVMTNELPRVHQALARAGVDVHTVQRVAGFADGVLTLQHMLNELTIKLDVRSLVIVGLRRPNDSLFHDLQARGDDLAAAGIVSLDRIGDALAPGAIAHAVHSGHEYGREFDRGANDRHYRRDRPVVTDPFAEHAYAATES